jgi:hypothetical protein
MSFVGRGPYLYDLGQPQMESRLSPQPAATQTGRIVQANNYGLFVVVEPQTKREYVFTLDKVVNYDGRDPKALGLIPGRDIRFLSESGRILRVEPM